MKRIKGVPPHPHIPPGAPRGWAEWCEASGLDPERPETHPNSARLAWALQEPGRLRILREKWQRYAADGTRDAIIRPGWEQGGRRALIKWVEEDWREVLKPYPTRSPYSVVRVPRLGLPEPKATPQTLDWLVKEYGPEGRHPRRGPMAA